MKEKIRWGILGLGNIAHQFAKAVTSLDNAELYAVASREKGRSESFGNKYGIALDKCYGSYIEMLRDNNVDAVYIAVPHTLHKEMSILSLENGKAVLCEKPVSVSYDDSYEIINTAAKKNLFFMEAMWTRFNPTTKKIMDWVQSGRIGNVRMIKADFGFSAAFDPRNRLFNAELGGGAHLDVGIYPVSYATMIMRELPEIVSSAAYIGETSVDYQNGCVLIYKNGAQALLSSSIITNADQDAYIIGDKGTIQIPTFWMATKAYLKINGSTEETKNEFRCNGYEYEAEEVGNCLNRGVIQSNVMPWDETLRVMKLMDKIREGWKR